MTAGRRALLSAAFLGGAALLSAGPARAQERSHKVWGDPLSPDQIRAALARLSAGEGGDPFQQMVKDFLLKNNPGIDRKKAEEAIRKLTGDPKLMEQLKQIARQKQTDPGRVGRLSPEELADLFRKQRDQGDFPKLPDDIKGFDAPKSPPGAEPKVNPDPRVGPMPMVDPAPKNKPPEVPPDVPGRKIEPPGPPAGNTPPKDNIKLDENPFPPPDEPADPRTKSLDALTALWERNIGPLDESPELQRALLGLLNNDGFDFDVKDSSGNSLWDLLKNGGADGQGLGDLFNDVAANGGGGNWDFGKLEWPKFGNWFGGSSTRPDGGSSSWFGGGSSRPRPTPPSGSGWGTGGGGSGFGGIGGAWLPFVLLLLVVVVVVVWLKLKNAGGSAGGGAFAAGLGPWPVDPRAINTREDVVLAFEYLSVLICGPSAKNWTHGTIAGALADLAATHEREALGLARLYELARYAPLDEPLTRSEVLEARELVCSLAGVS